MPFSVSKEGYSGMAVLLRRDTLPDSLEPGPPGEADTVAAEATLIDSFEPERPERVMTRTP